MISHRPLWLGLSLCLVLASEAPSIAQQGDIPTDAQVQPNEARLSAIVKERYPNLLTDKIQGIARVTILFASNGTVARTVLEALSRDAASLPVSEIQFERFGLSVDQLKYMGESRFKLGPNLVMVVFGGLGPDASLPSEK